MKVSLQVAAFSPLDSLTLRYDPAYIKKYPKYLALTPVLLFRNFTLGFDSGREGGRSVEYTPNVAPQWGLDLDYNWLSIEIASSWGMRGKGDQTKGKTFKLGLTGSLSRQKWIALGSIQYFKGLYISNPEELNEDFVHSSDAIFPRREDMKVLAGRLSVNHVFNGKKYSHASALFITTERQLKSSGSLLAGGSFNLIAVSADSTVIPRAIQPDFDSSYYVTNSQYYMLLGDIGYAYTLVINKSLFVNGSAQLGLGPVFSKNTPINTSLSRTGADIGLALDFRLGLGYNGDRLYGGVLTNIISIASSAGEESTINNSMYLVRFFVGYRFPIKFVIPILG